MLNEPKWETEAMGPQVGTEAPDFTLRDQNNEEVTLSSYRGKRSVLVVFYPFAFSPVCTNELCAVRDDLGSFHNDEVEIVAISVDHPHALKAWSQAQGYEFPLLSDFWPHGATAQAYGVFQDSVASRCAAPSSWTPPAWSASLR